MNMKKIFTIITLFVSVLAFSANATTVDLSKKDIRNIRKEAKAFVKTMEKDGYTPVEPGKFKGMVVEYLTAKKASDMATVTAVSGECQTENIAQFKLRHNTIVTYAEQGMSKVKGRVDSEVSDSNGEGVDYFYAAYERLVNTTVDANALEGFVVRKETENGKFIYRGYYVVNTDYVQMAMLNEIKKSALNEQHARQISEFVNEVFE